MSFMEQYDLWLNDGYFDDDTRSELRAIAGDEKEIEDRFYRDLEFGTGGLRGVIGAGTNRMNIYTVRRATQGLSDYILKTGGKERGVVIAYDSRRFSPEFAREAAGCLCANGIKAYVFESLRPTPELSFAVRFHGCIAGIVITASHNPPEYNGYKVYWEDGAQITPPRDKEILACVNSISDFHRVKMMDPEKAKESGLYTVIGKDTDDAYMEELKKLIIHPDVIREMAKDIKIVYTPLCGTGNIPVRRVLKELGFEDVYVVPQQEAPDPDFKTLKYPNPEDPEAFTLALELAGEKDADIVLATDPDADRLGIYSKDPATGTYKAFTGNMSGCLLAEYRLSELVNTGRISKNPVLVTTIVTSDMAKAIAKAHNVACIEVLTGFKYIGEQIKFFEEKGSYDYEFGLEESYGCLVGTHARDKDAVSAVMALCEAAAFYKKQGKSLWDQMLSIYEKYGYYMEGQHSVTLKGAEGAAKIASVIEGLRENPPSEFAGLKVLSFGDYKRGIVKSMEDGSESPTGLPVSNVLYFNLEEDAWCCVRPSGTEPKIKFYMGVKGSGTEDAASRLNKLREGITRTVSL